MKFLVGDVFKFITQVTSSVITHFKIKRNYLKLNFKGTKWYRLKESYIPIRGLRNI